MNKNKQLIVIGIPAYNEATSLPNLLKDLQKQSLQNNVMKVVVISDGSNDGTELVVKQLKLSNVEISTNKKRVGKSKIVSQIFDTNSNADAIVLLDADVRLLQKDVISQLVRPVFAKKADLVTAKVLELPPRNFLQKILINSMNLKRDIFDSLRNGKNLYTCHGRVRAFSPKLFNQLRIPSNASEDAFSYLFVQKNNLLYHYLKSVAVYYQIPSTLHDHIKQSQRFLKHTVVLSPHFSKEFLKKEYSIPISLACKKLIKYLIIHPILTTSYLFLLLLAKFLPKPTENSSPTWNIARSSKQTA